MGKLFQSLGVGRFSQGQGNCAGESFQIEVILRQVIPKCFQRQTTVLDGPKKGMFKDGLPDWLGFLFQLLAKAGHACHLRFMSLGQGTGNSDLGLTESRGVPILDFQPYSQAQAGPMGFWSLLRNRAMGGKFPAGAQRFQKTDVQLAPLPKVDAVAAGHQLMEVGEGH